MESFRAIIQLTTQTSAYTQYWGLPSPDTEANMDQVLKHKSIFSFSKLSLEIKLYPNYLKMKKNAPDDRPRIIIIDIEILFANATKAWFHKWPWAGLAELVEQKPGGD